MAGTWLTVDEQDCVHSIAARHGLFWETIWNDANNAELKQLRKNPNMLLAGDRVFVPDPRRRDATGATGRRNKFVRKGVPAMLRLFLQAGSEPRANLRYVLVIDGASQEGTTDKDGAVCAPIPPDAQEGRLTVFEGESQQSYELRLGAMDPVSENTGVAQRLRNLGFLRPPEGPGALAVALREFQQQQDLPVTGEPDASTVDALARAHKS